MKNEYFLTIDQGSHASRALIFDRYGDVIFEAYENTPYLDSKDGFIEYDPNVLISSVHTVIKKCISHLGSDSSFISCAGMATQRSSIAFLKRNTHELMHTIISWQDRRNNTLIESLEPHSAEIHKKSGLFLTPHYGASKIKWCLEHVKELKETNTQNTLLAGPLSSAICAHITKEHSYYADPANASRTQLWNIESHNWDPELLSLFGLDQELLPLSVPTYYDFGLLSYLGNNIPLKIVTGDQSAALFSGGTLDHSCLYVNIGTGAFISAPLGSKKVFHPKLLTSLVYKDEKHSEYVLEGTVNGAGSALEWAVSSLKIRLSDIKKINEININTVTPPLFMNGVSGLGSPYWKSSFTNEFIGSTENHDAVILAIIESIAFLIMSNIELMREHTGALERIRVSGGLSESDYLCQCLADLSRLTVVRPEEMEATAKGTAYLLLKDRDHWKHERVNKEFEYQRDTDITERFAQWKEHMDKLLIQ
jgi:glycerol kinase